MIVILKIIGVVVVAFAVLLGIFYLIGKLDDESLHDDDDHIEY
jgi:hypothetical protein